MGQPSTPRRSPRSSGDAEFRAGWPQGIAPPGLPRIRTCPFRHTALHIMNSLRDGSLSESAPPSRTRRRDRCRFVGTVLGFDAPAMFPSNGVMTWRPLLSTGSLGMVPPLQRYYGTLRLPAVRLDPFDILHEPIPSCRPWFAPLGRGRPTGGQGVVGSGLPIRIDDGNVGVSQVPWKPWWSLSVLFDPGRIRQAEWTKSKLPDTAPACVHDEGSKRLVLSGLNHTTFDLTVYASQDGSPHHHARLASGCWSSFTRRDSYPQGFSERFQSSSLFLLSKAYLTQEHHT